MGLGFLETSFSQQPSGYQVYGIILSWSCLRQRRWNGNHFWIQIELLECMTMGQLVPATYSLGDLGQVAWPLWGSVSQAIIVPHSWCCWRLKDTIPVKHWASPWQGVRAGCLLPSSLPPPPTSWTYGDPLRLEEEVTYLGRGKVGGNTPRNWSKIHHTKWVVFRRSDLGFWVAVG